MTSSADVRVMVEGQTRPELNTIVSPGCALRSALRSDPMPASPVLVTTSVDASALAGLIPTRCCRRTSRHPRTLPRCMRADGQGGRNERRAPTDERRGAEQGKVVVERHRAVGVPVAGEPA